mgnify:FL=1|jgi:hypothetical protein
MKKNSKTYPYAIKNISKIVIVSGNTRSGKAIALKIIASLSGVEKVNVSHSIETANFLNFTKNISKETAIYLQRRTFSKLDYNLRIGREVNLRKPDFTSIYKYRDPKRYLRNLNTKEGDHVIKILKKEKNVIPLMIHNALLTTNLFEAFDNLVMFEMIRNPVSTIFSWIKKKYDNKFYYSYRVGCLTLKYKNKIIPYYAYGWEAKYLKLNKYEKIIEMFLMLEKQKDKTIKKLNKINRNKIFYIKLEDLHAEPNIILKNLEKVLKKKRTNYTNKILKQESLPRSSTLIDIQKKRNILKKKISSGYFKKLLLLESKYSKTR